MPHQKYCGVPGRFGALVFHLAPTTVGKYSGWDPGGTFYIPDASSLSNYKFPDRTGV